MNIKWEDCQTEFASDGALRDVQVLDATAADWEKVFDFLLKNATDLNFTIDGKAAELPTSASAAIAMRGNASPALQFRWGTIEFATHFFGEDDLEFHFRPELIRSPSDLDKLLSFLAAIGSQIGKIVIVYHEGWEMSPFLEYNKQTCTVTYLPPRNK